MAGEDASSQAVPNWDYDASKPAALVFCGIFGLSLLAHFGQAIHHRTPWVWPLIVGLILETEGVAFRWYSIVKLYTSMDTIITRNFTRVLTSGKDYMMVGRMISYLGKEWSPISHTLITKIFVVGDLLSILTQALGGSILNSTDLKTIRIGFNILIAALVFQIVMFSIFLAFTPLFIAFYISAAMIILRSIYRMFEFASVKFTTNSASGYTVNHEWLLYVFDALPITAAVVTLNVIHAGRFLPRKKGMRLDGTIEEEAPSRVCGCCSIYKRPRTIKYDTNGYSMYHPLYMKQLSSAPQEA